MDDATNTKLLLNSLLQNIIAVCLAISSASLRNLDFCYDHILTE